jgi:plasmid stabilization system protein ParE
MPYLGAAVPEYDDDSIRELLEQAYRIIYRVRADRIDILSIVHGSRPLPSEIPGNGS